MISLNVKAWLENIVLGLVMGAKGCADLSAFRAPAVNIGHFQAFRAVAGACSRGGCKKPRFGLGLSVRRPTGLPLTLLTDAGVAQG